MADFPALLKELKELDAPTSQRSSTICMHDHQSSATYSSSYHPASPHSNNLESTKVSSPENETQLYSNAHSSLLNQMHQLKAALSTLGTHLNAKIANGSAAVEYAAADISSAVSTALHFSNWRVTVAYNCYWSLLILTNKIMMKMISQYDPRYYELEVECRNVALEICKTWEDAWASKPIGAFHTGLSFVMAYEYCTPPVQKWIISRLNALLDHQHVETFRWNEKMIHMMSGKLAGEGPELIFSAVN
jgi:hypothetical protein